jgi:glycosyltransferase involved in cell wall biosynthesis
VTEPSLLLLIPAYNEESRIEPVLRDYARYFQDQYDGKFSLAVVLNGCRDNTLGVVQKVAAEFPSIRAENFPDPIGKGGALIEGLKLTPAMDVIGYVDADGASPPRALHDLVKLIDKADCVIGSRCCKVIRRSAVERIHSSLRIADLAFDVNLLYSLKHAGFSILEVPTEWTDKIGSKVTASLFRASLTMFLSVLRIRLIYSPLYRWLRPLRPVEAWIYKKLRAPQPRPGPDKPKPPETEKKPDEKRQ